MGTKTNPGKFDCYANALPDEPMFVLLARDTHAPLLVEMWAAMRYHDIMFSNKPESDAALVTEAQRCACAMREWRNTHNGEWRNLTKPTALALIHAERKRQIEVEKFFDEHDDKYMHGELLAAAIAYATNPGTARTPPLSWPWDNKWWKPRTKQRDLVRAGALVLAEISRRRRLVKDPARCWDKTESLLREIEYELARVA